MSGGTGRQCRTSDARVTCSSRPISKLSCGRTRCITLFKFLLENADSSHRESQTFVSFLTFTSTCWQSLPSHPLRPSYRHPLVTSTVYANANCYKGTQKPRGVALLACDLLYGM